MCLRPGRDHIPCLIVDPSVPSLWLINYFDTFRGKKQGFLESFS